MTSPGQPDGRREELFIADFYPGLGAYLARRHAGGYDAVAARASFLLWLAAHTDQSMDDLARTAPTPRLSGAEETDARASLERIAQEGGQARDRLLDASRWLVVSLAEGFAGRGVPLPELIQKGNLGLVRAIEQYDRTMGYEFATYASWWIRQEMTRAVAAGLPRLSVAPVPEPAAGGMDELAVTERRMLQALGREPTAEELAAELDLSP